MQTPVNRPFPSCPKPLFRSEVKCEAVDIKMNIYSHANETGYNRKGFVLAFVLNVRVFRTRKWPILTMDTFLSD